MISYNARFSLVFYKKNNTDKYAFMKLKKTTMWIMLVIIIALGGFLLWYVVAKVFFLQSVSKQRAQAIKQSKSVHKWLNNEKLAPFLPGFAYSPRDMVFIGKGIDYLVFDGLSRGQVTEVILLEIKTGSSTLNRNEKMIQEAIQSWRVRYEILKK